MLSFGDEELAAIGALSAPLPPPDRSNFLQIVAARIAPYPPDARGPSLIYKVATQVQREILRGGTIAIGPEIFARRQAAIAAAVSQIARARAICRFAAKLAARYYQKLPVDVILASAQSRFSRMVTIGCR